MKVKKKYLSYENLPCVGCKENLMAAYGMYMDPGPRMPYMQGAMANYPTEMDHPFSQVQGIQPIPMGTPPDTSKVVPGKMLDPKLLGANKPKGKGFDAGNAALAAMIGIDAAIPNPYNRHPAVQPQMAYNPMPYGYGSQALMKYGGAIPIADYGYVMGEDESNSPSAKAGMYLKGGTLEDRLVEAKDGHWIQKAVNPKHKGYCTPMTKSTCTPKRKALAKTFKKMAKERKKEDGGHINDYMDMITKSMDIGGFIQPGWDQYKIGGIIPDNMSAFSPHEYANGGTQRGGSDTTDLLEQWMAWRTGDYKNGGTARGGSDTTDLLEQWIPWMTGEYADGGDLQPSQVKDSRGFVQDASGRYKYSNDDPRNPNHMALRDYSKEGQYAANIPQPAYNPANIGGPSNYSATFPEGAGQHTTYFQNYDNWKNFMGTFGQGMISSQETADKSRASAALKGKPMKNGGSTRGGSDTTDLLEQWIPWMTGEYAQGGTLSPEKAKEMLADGTANGKKLTKKQKQYFGMVAAGKAAMGTEIGMTGPTDPKPKTALTPGVAPKGSATNWDARKLQGSQISQNALLADRLAEIVGQGYDPFANQGKGIMDDIRKISNNPQLAMELGARVKSLQIDPTFGKLSPEQRITRLYTPSSGTTQADQFLNATRSLGGNPAAYYQGNPTNTSRFANGGILYDDGGSINTMWGGKADLESYNPYDGGTVEFNGASHDNGGIGMAYNGNPVEVEGGEYASKDGDGNLTIYGNMLVPGTKTKFKKAASAIADKEKRYDMLRTKGSDLVNDSNPASKFEQLKFNAGRVMMQGGQMGQEDLASKKEKLASLQRAMLDMAESHGLDPNAMSQGKMKKAKGGASIPFYEDGGTDPGNDPTRADRNRNPGNIKYGEFAKKYGARPDKDGFAVFPNRNSGLSAMKDLLKSDNYNSLDVDSAIRKWTGGQPYRYDLSSLRGKKVGDLSNDEMQTMLGVMTKGEGTRYGLTPRTPSTTPTGPAPKIPEPGPFTPYTIPGMDITPQTPGSKPVKPKAPYDTLDVPNRGPIKSDVESLHMNQILPELYAAATNKVEPVPGQRYEPQLYTPYQVSFQDRLNSNQSGFNAQMRAVGPSNPAAIGTLAAQKYAADSAVLGDEFRTNQSIANDITNKNVALVNDANMKNLGIADTQMVRQSEARSKTRQLNQMILNSLSSKYAQNDLENKRLATYENLYDYRFVPQEDGGLSATYFGPNAMFNYSGHNATGQKPQDVRTISRYDAAGNLRGYNEYDESDLKEMQRRLDMDIKRRKEPLLELAPLR